MTHKELDELWAYTMNEVMASIIFRYGDDRKAISFFSQQSRRKTGVPAKIKRIARI